MRRVLSLLDISIIMFTPVSATGEDDLTITTKVGSTFIVKFTEATESDGNYVDLADSVPMDGADDSSARSKQIRVQYDTNLPESISLYLTGTALMRFPDETSDTPVENDSPIKLTVSVGSSDADGTSVEFTSKADVTGVPAGTPSLQLKENNGTPRGFRSGGFVLNLSADMSTATAGFYKAFLKVSNVAP